MVGVLNRVIAINTDWSWESKVSGDDIFVKVKAGRFACFFNNCSLMTAKINLNKHSLNQISDSYRLELD